MLLGFADSDLAFFGSLETALDMLLHRYPAAFA